MTNETALEILLRMADGVDPDTGELLAADHLCNRPAVIRALIAAVQALSSQLSLGEAQTLLLRHTAASLQPRLHAALRHGSLGQVFFAL